jgi:L,D-transpeptidase catalytic domain/TAT (twin-arginine translocation) pathway signal sequence
MNQAMNRRDILKGSLVAGAALALPDQFDQAFGTAPVQPAAEPLIPAPPPLPTAVVPNPAYDRRVLEIARREVERAGAVVWRRDIVPRFHFANLENGTVRSFYVAHGRGSDPEHSGFLQAFSGVPGSEATSRGAYLTCEWYKGKYGTSIRLEGLDPDNRTALERAIVMHPASYANPAHIAKFGKLGRSEGCFAMAPDQFNEALWHLSGGRLLYADRIEV